mgnify:CR=1 FL=1
MGRHNVKELFIVIAIGVIAVFDILYVSDADKVVTILSTAIAALAGMAGVQAASRRAADYANGNVSNKECPTNTNTNKDKKGGDTK